MSAASVITPFGPTASLMRSSAVPAMDFDAVLIPYCISPSPC